MTVGFPHHAGRYRPGGSPFSSPGCWSSRYLEGSGDGILSSPGAERPQRWPEVRLSQRAGSMSPSQSAISRWVGVSTPCGAVSTRGITVIVPGFWICRCMEGFPTREWDLILPGGAGASTLVRGATSTPCGAVSILGIAVFVPSWWSCRDRYRGNADLGLRPYPPRLR